MPASRRPLNICIAASDIVGPIRNGGIGTWYHALACAMAAAGHNVTILYVLGKHSEIQTIAHWQGYYSAKDVDFICLPDLSAYTGNTPIWIRSSYEVYQWLKERDGKFDFVHFHEWRGHGFYSVLAKRQGLAFANTLLVVGTHSPTLWHKWGMAEYIVDIEDLQTDHLERLSVAYCDAVVSPSRYMIEWITGRGWKLPQQVDCIQYIQSHYKPQAHLDTVQNQNISELVFFGRLETRKGLQLFCDAVDRLAPDTDISLTFLGKRAEFAGTHSGAYLETRAKKWRFKWRIADDRDHIGAITYLRQPGRLAVICSLLENSPNTVLECLANGIPCLSTNVGGIPELIAEADRDRILFPPKPAVLAELLQCTICHGILPAKPAIHPDITTAQWLQWHDCNAPAQTNESHPASAPHSDNGKVGSNGDYTGNGKFTGNDGKLPRVSVCVATRNRPALLRQAIDSLRAQDYQNFEVILVDDGSTTPDAMTFLDGLQADFDRRGWKVIRQTNQYLGAARNNAARQASGEYLLFMDDDNVAKPHELSTFARAATTSSADVLTCLMDEFSGPYPPSGTQSLQNRWLCIGGATAVGAFTNLFGDANALIRKSVFDALGGFTEDYGTTQEDWEFYASAALNGYTLLTVPEPLFWYRVAGDSMLRSTSHFANHMRSLRPYLKRAGPRVGLTMEFAQGLYFSQRPVAPPAAQPAPLHIRGERAPSQQWIDELWSSLSWRLGRPLRNAVLRWRGLPPEARPVAATRQDAAQVINSIRDSVSWEITGPLRAMGRVVNVIRRK